MGSSQSSADSGSVNSTKYVRVVKPSLSESLGLSKSEAKKGAKPEEKPARRSSFLDCCVSRSKEDGTEPVVPREDRFGSLEPKAEDQDL